MIFSIGLLFSGFIVYHYCRKAGNSFFLAFLLLLPLWGPRCVVGTLGANRPLELRWEDIFTIALFIEMVVQGKWRFVWGKGIKLLTFFLLSACYILIIRFAQPGGASALLYLIFNIKLLLYLVVVGFYLHGVSEEISKKEFIKHFLNISSILLILIFIGNIYQFLSKDYAFNKSFGRLFGTLPWKMVSGGTIKTQARATLLFDAEPITSGSVILFLSIIITVCKKNGLIWLLIGFAAVGLSLSKSGILSYGLYILFYFGSVFRKKENGLFRSRFIMYGLLVFGIVTVFYLIYPEIQVIFLNAVERLLNIFNEIFSKYSSNIGVLSRLSITTFKMRLEIIYEIISKVTKDFGSLLLGFSAYRAYDNNFLYLLSVYGLVGLSTFLITHYSYIILRMKNLRYFKQKERNILLGFYYCFAFTFCVLSLTSEPLRHFRTLYFIYPSVLVFDSIFIKEKEIDKLKNNIYEKKQTYNQSDKIKIF